MSGGKALWATGLVAILGLEILSRETVFILVPAMIHRRDGKKKPPQNSMFIFDDETELNQGNTQLKAMHQSTTY